MSGYPKAFGKPVDISGSAGAFKSTLVPLDMVRELSIGAPYPITITGANQVTFTLNSSVTNKIPIWSGDDFVSISESVSYTWTAVENNILSSAGAETTLTGSTLGIWYFYLYLNSGVPTLLPSQTAPSQVEGPYPNGHFAHPGTSRTRPYSYVGLQLCTTAATPVFAAMTKIGKRYNFAALSAATATTWAELGFTGATALPAHGALGATVGGKVNVGAGADSTIAVGSTSSNALGVTVATVSGTTSQDVFYPMPDMVPTANGSLYAQHTVAAGDVQITWINDIR